MKMAALQPSLFLVLAAACGLSTADSPSTCQLVLGVGYPSVDGGSPYPVCSSKCGSDQSGIWYQGVAIQRFSALHVEDQLMVTADYQNDALVSCSLVPYKTTSQLIEEVAACKAAEAVCLGSSSASTDTPTDAPATTDAITDTPTDAPATTDAISDIPTDAPATTDAITDIPTDAPATTDAITDTPTDAPATTDAITDTPTDAPATTDAITDTPTEAPATTDAITDTPTEAPATANAPAVEPTTLEPASDEPTTPEPTTPESITPEPTTPEPTTPEPATPEPTTPEPTTPEPTTPEPTTPESTTPEPTTPEPTTPEPTTSEPTTPEPTTPEPTTPEPTTPEPTTTTIPTTTTTTTTTTRKPIVYTCPSGHQKYKDASCYMVPAHTDIWTNANSYCTDRGYSLARIESLDEQKFVAALMNEDTWIDLNDRVTEGKYLFTNGRSTAFTYWDSGEPNDSYWGEDCVEMRKDAGFRWNDKSCDMKRRFVCEKPTTVL